MIQESFSAQFVVYFNSFFSFKFFMALEETLKLFGNEFSYLTSLELTFELLASINLLNLSARLKEH